MRIYEELFIVRPDATEEEVEPVIEQMKGVITHAGGTIEKVENGVCASWRTAFPNTMKGNTY